MTLIIRLDTKYNRDTQKGTAIVRVHGKTGSVPIKAEGANHASLVALIEVLGLVGNETAIIETRNAYLASGCNEWLAIWNDRGWETADGKPVQYADEWRIIDSLLDGSKASVAYAHGVSPTPSQDEGVAA